MINTFEGKAIQLIGYADLATIPGPIVSIAYHLTYAG
jgi:hypothetical protein